MHRYRWAASVAAVLTLAVGCSSESDIFNEQTDGAAGTSTGSGGAGGSSSGTGGSSAGTGGSSAGLGRWRSFGRFGRQRNRRHRRRRHGRHGWLERNRWCGR